MPKKAKKILVQQQQVEKSAAAAAAAAQENEELKELVITFNDFPRAHMTNGHVNHWHLSVRHIPAGDVLHIVNPESRATHTEGPATILTLKIDSQAEVVLRLLLKAFVKSIANTFTPAVVPWSWGTQDEDLAQALQTNLTTANVRVGLCRIDFGNKDHIKIAKELWERDCEKMAQLANTICRKCRKSPTGTQKFQRCSGCKQVQYCSKDCQRGDWKQHKKFCQLLNISTSTSWSGTKGTEAAYDGVTYHVRTSSKSPYIQTLAKKIGLKLPEKCLT